MRAASLLVLAITAASIAAGTIWPRWETEVEEAQMLVVKKNASEIYREKCHAFKECFCIRHSFYDINNVCGWCESLKRPMVGSPNAPDASEGECAWWIFYAQDCPYLHCSEDIGHVLMWVLVVPISSFAALAGLVNFLIRPRDHAVVIDPGFVEVERTLDEFKNGLWGTRTQKPRKTYQLTWEMGSSTLLVLQRLADSTSLWKAFGRVSTGGVAAATFMTFMRLCPMFMDAHTFKMLGVFMAQSQETVGTLKMILGLLFSFYALGRVGWWWHVMDCGRTIQGRTHDIAMLVGGAGSSEDHSDQEEWWQKKWTLFRHLMLAFFLCYRPLVPGFQQISDDQLVKLGLAEAEELAILRKSMYPRKVTLKWISLWVEGNIQDKHLRQLIQDKLCGLRAGFATLHDTLEVRAPWTFEALLYVMVYLWVFLMPLGIINANSDRLLVMDTPIFLPTLNFMIVAAFYLTMLNLLEAFKDPFGTHTDSMHVQTLFLETEASVVDYLTSPVTTHLKSVCKDTLTNRVST